MRSQIRIVSARPDLHHTLAAKLLAIQRSAYEVEAELIGDDRIPILHESVHELRDAPLNWLVAFGGADEPVGAVAWKSMGESVDIDRLVVSPLMHRQGIGRGLVTALLDATAESRFAVATGRENKPARALYESLGFMHVRDEEIVDRLWLARYRLDR